MSDEFKETAIVPLPAEPLPPQADAAPFAVEYTGVAPFPRKKFEAFCASIKVQSKDFGLVPFRMLGSQKYILDELEQGLAEGITTFVILKARQLGASTFFMALDLFWAFEHRGLLGTFVIHKEEAREDFRTQIEVFFAETPKTHRVNYVRHNRNLLMLKNGSKFRYLIAGTHEGRAGGLGRSGSANYVHATEVAFYGTGEPLAEFRSQTSSLYPHRLQVYETTANGFNWFWDMWEGSRRDPTKKCVFVGWWRDERNKLPTSHPHFRKFMPDGASEPLSPLERKRCREVREQYGFDISLQQVAWYRWHLASEKDNDQGIMDQEYPWTAEDAFVATGSKFFTVESLSTATREARRQPFMLYRYRLTQRFAETTLQAARDARAPLRVWHEASKFGLYALGCDPAFGSSDEADRTCISVWRCFSDCMVQVAEYCSSEPSTYQCAWVLAHLAGYYGQTYCMPILEITGPGQAVFAELRKLQGESTEIDPRSEERGLRNFLQHMRHFYFRRIDSITGGLVYQWKTSEDLKRRMMNELKNGIELNRMTPRSVPLLEEMRRIVNDEGHIGGEGRAKDDRVVAAALAYQAWSAFVQPKCKAEGLTLAEAMKLDERGTRDPIDRLIVNYLKRSSIVT